VRARERPRDYVEQVEAGITAQFINKLNAIIATGIASYTPDVSEVNTMIQNYVKANMITNNDAATVSGTAWDAVRGKAIRDAVTAINDNLGDIKSIVLADASVGNAKSVIANKWNMLTTGNNYIAKVYDLNYQYTAFIQCSGPQHGACLIIGYTLTSIIYGKLDTGVWTWT
jgi:hypothetical protein